MANKLALGLQLPISNNATHSNQDLTSISGNCTPEVELPRSSQFPRKSSLR